jgi:hypothetical protein
MTCEAFSPGVYWISVGVNEWLLNLGKPSTGEVEYWGYELGIIDIEL